MEQRVDSAPKRPLRVAVFASGGGSNLQAILDHLNAPGSDVCRVTLVVSDRHDAGALERAARAEVPTRVIAVRGKEVDDIARDTLDVLGDAGIDLVALAGYIRLVPAEVVRAYHGRMLNIHPALLPAFGGRGMYGSRVHRAVIEAGCRVSGATVHLVDEEYDRGPILFQWPVPVVAGDTPETLAARVLRVEHRIYPATIEAVARALVSGEPLRPMPLGDSVAFDLRDADGPDVWEVRRTLGLARE